MNMYFFTAVLIDETRRNNSFPSLLFEGTWGLGMWGGRAWRQRGAGALISLISIKYDRSQNFYQIYRTPAYVDIGFCCNRGLGLDMSVRIAN